MCHAAPACVHLFFHDAPPTEIYTLSLHDALPICASATRFAPVIPTSTAPSCTYSGMSLGRTSSRSTGAFAHGTRSEEHTSELQSPYDLVCRLLLEKKKNKTLTSTWSTSS